MSDNMEQSTIKGNAERQSTKKANTNKQHQPKAGDCEELGTHVFDYGNNTQADQYNKTLEKILNYIRSNYKGGQAVVDMINNKQEPKWEETMPTPRVYNGPNPTEPAELARNATAAQRTNYNTRMQAYLTAQANMEQIKNYNNLKLKEHMAKETQHHQNCDMAFGLVLGQCTLTMTNKLEQSEEWETVKSNHNPLELLKLIKKITLKCQDSIYPMIPAFTAMHRLVNMKQGETEGMNNFKKRFQAEREMLESQFGSLLPDAYLNNLPAYTADGVTEEAKATIRKEAQEQFISYMFLQAAGATRSGEVLRSLANAFAQGNRIWMAYQPITRSYGSTRKPMRSHLPPMQFAVTSLLGPRRT